MRGTKKLRDRASAPPPGIGDESTTVLGDWFATAMFWRPQVVMFVNERTLLPVFVPLAPAATLFERAPAAIGSVLRRHGVSDAVVAAEVAAMHDVRLAPTNNRSILGVMHGFTEHSERRFQAGLVDLEELSMAVSFLVVGPLMKGEGAPDRELAAVFGIGDRTPLPSNVIAFPGTYRPDGSPAPAKRQREFGGVYQLKITIQNIKPRIWRRVLVDGSSTLDQLHLVIQAAFGWWNHHLHEFEFDGIRYGVPDPDDDWGMPTRDGQFTPLDSVTTEGSTFDYTYDFGDGWTHRVVVEKVMPAAGLTVPACTGGRRACPPEDCGGPWGYQELLDILADPTHEEHRVQLEWIGHPIDPEAFDPSDFEAKLREVSNVRFEH